MLQCNYAALFHPHNHIVGRQAAAAWARCSAPPAPTSTATSPPKFFKQDSSLGIGYWADDSGACGPFSRKPVSQPRSQPGVDRSICTTPSIVISLTLEPSSLQGIHTRAWVAAETTKEAAHRAYGSANRNTVGSPAISLTQNGDGFPDITAPTAFRL